MRAARLLTAAIAISIILSELARWRGDPRLIPMALDEIALGLAMLAATALAGRYDAALLGAAWAAFSGFMLSLLVPTLDHLLNGPPKESAGFYALLLSAMLVLGLAMTGWTLGLARRSAR